MQQKSIFTLLLIVCVLSSYYLSAQDLGLKPVSDTYVIQNVNIVQAPGRVIPFGTILIENGLIKAVGTNVKIPTNAQVVEADSMYVYAGFIDGLTHAGVPSEEPQRVPDDVLAMAPPYKWAGITPEINVYDVFDSEDKSISQLREAGVTIAQVVPKGGMLAGQGALILTREGEKSTLFYKTNTTIFASLNGARGVFPATTIGVMAKMRDLYKNASQAASHLDNYRSNPAGLERPDYDPVFNALIPVTRKNQTLTYDVEDDLDAHRVLTLKKELGFNLVFANGESMWNAIPQIKASGAGVFLSVKLPKEFSKDTSREIKTDFDRELDELETRKEEAYKMHAAQAAKFHSAGISFGLSSMNGKPGDIKSTVRTMIEYGLPEEAALAALTVNPARILGITSSAGTVDAGKLANLVVSTGPYFEESSKIKYVFVDGEMFEYDTKEKKKGTGDATVVLGTWEYEASDQDGSSGGILVFEQSGSEITGSMTNDQVPVPGEVSDVSLDGSELSFTIVFSVQGETMEINATVTIDGDSFSGELIAPFGSILITGTKNPNK